jgi:hypothetical protein
MKLSQSVLKAVVSSKIKEECPKIRKMSKISIDSYRETVEAVCNALIPASDSLITVIEENADLFGEIAAKLYPVYKRLEAELEKVS